MKMKLAVKHKLSVLIVVFLICIVQPVFSQPLKSITEDPEYKALTRSSSRALPFPGWLNPNSNYVKLFSYLPSSEVFDRFINVPEKVISSKAIRKPSPQFVQFEQSYFFASLRNQNVKVVIFIPHPAVLDLADSGNLPSLLSFIPAPSLVSEKSTLIVHEKELEVMQLSRGGFVMMLKLPMQVRIFVQSNSQQLISLAHDLIEKSHMDWLVEQLSS